MEPAGAGVGIRVGIKSHSATEEDVPLVVELPAVL
jgi:hypothetical protein